MKRITIKQCGVLLAVLAVAVVAFFGVKQANAAAKRLESIEAFYIGEPIAVGGTINVKDFYLTAEYTIDDGYNTYPDYVEVNRGFTISPSVISQAGENQIVVTYRGKTAEVVVEGKTVEYITAEYTGEELYVGTVIPQAKIEVYAYYNDGSSEKLKNKDLVFSTAKVEEEGTNVVTITYQEKVAYVYIDGKAPLAIESLEAFYTGDSVIQGNKIAKAAFEVTAIYNDGSTKEIENFSISPTVITEVGENEILVSYGEYSTTAIVYGEERFVEDMSVKYTGYGVIVGKKIDREDIEVTLTYNDGSTELTEDFELYGEEILYEGENIVLIYCDAFSGDIIVNGVKGFAANYDNCQVVTFYSNDLSAESEITLGLNMGVEQDKFFFKIIDQKMADYMVRRVMKSEEYIAFELAYDDDEMVLEFPMAMKVTVPDEYDPEDFGVYYTRYNSTVMAKVDGDFTDDTMTEFEFIVHEPGYYILMHEVVERLVTDIVVEEEITLRVNRNFSLNPVVFPKDADNSELMYSSTDEDVATVTESGKLRTHSPGTCEIWIETTDGSGVYKVVKVTVVER